MSACLRGPSAGVSGLSLPSAFSPPIGTNCLNPGHCVQQAPSSPTPFVDLALQTQSLPYGPVSEALTLEKSLSAQGFGNSISTAALQVGLLGSNEGVWIAPKFRRHIPVLRKGAGGPLLWTRVGLPFRGKPSGVKGGTLGGREDAVSAKQA